MYEYTYFIITPGVDIGSFIKYSDGAEGNYFKFGDTHDPHKDGVRAGYSSHNPDIGIAAVLTNGLGNDNLGNKIKHALVDDGYQVVPGTQEWFSVGKNQAWALFHAVQLWDGATIDGGNYEAFKQDVLNALNTNA